MLCFYIRLIGISFSPQKLFSRLHRIVVFSKTNIGNPAVYCLVNFTTHLGVATFPPVTASTGNANTVPTAFTSTRHRTYTSLSTAALSISPNLVLIHQFVANTVLYSKPLFSQSQKECFQTRANRFYVTQRVDSFVALRTSIVQLYFPSGNFPRIVEYNLRI